jgi:hypothetical protein
MPAMRAATTSVPLPRGGRVELIVALGLAWVLVIARSLVYAVYPHSSFDSDQAIIGLMAKHISEGRAFPLYLYGQSYLLAIEPWLTVPYFWIAGPTVAALRASLIGLNLAVVTLLIVGLQRWGGLRPLTALAAVTFFAFAPPLTTAQLVDAGGGSIEQFLWVLVLWFVRRRPFVFGSALGVAFLNREFTVYAVPVLIAGQIWSGTFFRRDSWRRWLFALVAFVAVWQAVQALKPLADPMGPGTRGAMAGRDVSQLGNLTQRLRLDVAAVPSGVSDLLAGDVRWLLGGRRVEEPIATQGRDWMGWLLGLSAIAAIGRIGWLARHGSQLLAKAAAGWYLLGVGAMAVVGYALTRPTNVVTARYLLLSILIPIGLTAVLLALEPRRLVRQCVVAMIAVWAVVAGIDNWRQYERYASGREVDGLQQLIAELDRRSIRLAEAEHWRAYKITFLAEERIKVASTDVIRIKEYRDLADAAGQDLIRLTRTPCPGAEPIGGMYICGDTGASERRTR